MAFGNSALQHTDKIANNISLRSELRWSIHSLGEYDRDRNIRW